MSVERFGQEESSHRLTEDAEPSVLLQARWKRIILGNSPHLIRWAQSDLADEGHIAGTKTSNAMRLAQKLSIERRWAVSGTPTKYLKQGADLDISMPSRLHSPASDLPSPAPRAHAWSTRDLDDAGRIGVGCWHTHSSQDAAEQKGHYRRFPRCGTFQVRYGIPRAGRSPAATQKRP